MKKHNLIYIVEDDESIRELETYALRNSDFDVEAFDCAKQLFEKIAQKQPQLIVLDVMLPDDDGLKVLTKLKNSPLYNHIPVVLVTAKTGEIDAVIGLDRGADDYIKKPFGVMELISRVKAVLRRCNTANNNILQYENIVIDEGRHEVLVDAAAKELTYKEYEILKILIRNKGIVLTRDLLMENVWGYDFEQGNRTVDVHIQSLRKKLGSAGDSIKTIRNVGYKIGE